MRILRPPDYRRAIFEELVHADVPLRQLRVGTFRPTAVGWGKEALRCITLVRRMVAVRAVCPRLLRQVVRWVRILRFYARDFGWADDSKTTTSGAALWIVRELDRIVREGDRIEEAPYHKSKIVEFYPAVHWAGRPSEFLESYDLDALSLSRCPRRRLWRYRTILENGVEIQSERVRRDAFERYEGQIRRGLELHRNKEMRQRYVEDHLSESEASANVEFGKRDVRELLRWSGIG